MRDYTQGWLAKFAALGSPLNIVGHRQSPRAPYMPGYGMPGANFLKAQTR